MKKSIRLLFLLFTFIIVFGCSNSYAQRYEDTRGHWAEKYIDNMSNAGFILGYEPGVFQPDNFISRAEFYSVINSMAGLEKTYTVTFSDVEVSDWYYRDVAKAIKAGYLHPTTGRLNPNMPISRQDVMGIIGYMYKLRQNPSSVYAFADSREFSSENIGYAGALIDLRVISGGPDATLRPNDGISRGEICKILDILMMEYGLPDKRVVMDSKIKFGDRNLYN